MSSRSSSGPAPAPRIRYTPRGTEQGWADAAATLAGAAGYAEGSDRHIPGTLRDAREELLRSDMLRDAFGAETVAHYARAAEWEIEEFNRVVTNYEIARGFEKA